MPLSVVVAIVALGVFLVLNLLGGLGIVLQDPTSWQFVRLAGSLMVSGLLAAGFYTGHRLAWQWGRILGILAAVMFTLGIFVAGGAANVELLARFFLGILAACLYVIFFALGTESARTYFKLRCPGCNEFTNAAANFFFTRARCNKCGKVW